MNVDIVEGTYQHFKIEAKFYLSPLKLMFSYKNDLPKDLKIMYSRINKRPEEN